ncbi:hypothetical protein BABINDRAFT_18614, partial [Babjeviella inositovora NRRL Y-12698]
PETLPALPQEYVDQHTPEFIKGVEYVLSKDPNLYATVVLKPFDAYLKTVSHQFDDADQQLQFWFESLCSGIISQQVSGAAAKSIKRKFLLYFLNGKTHLPLEELAEKWQKADKLPFPGPQDIIDCSDEELRTCGLSGQKVKYVNSVAENFQNKELNAKVFQSDDIPMIVDKLVAIKGIGVWSAKMFLLFALKKMNVYTMEDLGIARGVSIYFSNIHPELHETIKGIVTFDGTKKKKSKIAVAKNRNWLVIQEEYGDYFFDQFEPYQSVIMVIMWRLSDTMID